MSALLNVLKTIYNQTIYRLFGRFLDSIILFGYGQTISILVTYFVKNRKFKSMPNVKKGFEDHRPAVIVDNAAYMDIFRRIANAFHKAKADQLILEEPYKAGIKWQQEIDSHASELLLALHENNAEKLQKLLENFHREIFSFGLQGNSDYSNMKQKPLHKYLFVNTWYKFFNYYKELTFDSQGLTYPMTGNPVGLYDDGQVIPYHAIRFQYSATEILNLLEDISHPLICEIGSGLGGQAYAVSSSSQTDLTYLALDLPEVLVVASYFLMASLPEKNFLLYGEEPLDSGNLGKYDVVLMPNFALPQLGDETVDLFFNNSSFSEMDGDTVREYLHQIERIGKRYFMHINHNTRFSWYEGDKETTNLPSTQVIPDPKLFKKIYQHPWMLNTLPEELHYKGAEFQAFLYERRRVGF